MLKPPDCVTNDGTEEWVEFTARLMKLLTNPAVAIFFVVAVGVVAVLSWQRQPIRRWVMGLSLGAIALLMALPLMGAYALPAFVPADTGEPADAIVVLGRGRLLRAGRQQKVVELLEAGRAPFIFISGKGDAPYIARALETEYGLPPAVLDGEACSRTTAENGQYTAQVLMPQDVKRILLVTDPLQMLRASLILRSLGFEVDHHPSPLPAKVSRYRRQVLAAREAVGFTTYWLSGRFRPKT